jgi:hypothetical protein
MLRDVIQPMFALTHIMLVIIFHALHDYFVYHMYVCNSDNLYLLHMKSSILRKTL